MVNEYLNSKYGLVPAVPAAPSNLVAQAISQTQVSLTWNDTLNQGATQVSIERKASGGSYAVVAQVSSTLSFIDTNLTAGTTYYYRVRAINLTGWSAYSNEAQATTPANGSDFPLGSLALWLKADSGLPQLTNGPVNIWPDQSGKGNHALQTTAANQPLWVAAALNGLPVVHFNGTSHYFNLPNVLAGTTQAEALVVLRVTTNTPTCYPTLWRWGTCGGSYNLSYPSPSGQIVDDFGSTAAHNLGVPTQPLTQYHVYEVAGQSGSWSAWINGVLQGSANANTYGVWGSAWGLGVDLSYIGNNHYFAGDLAEVLIFNRTITIAERQTVNEYLNSKYGLVPPVPAAPTNLVAQALSPTQVSLTWNATLNQGATQISIERRAGGGSYAMVAQVSSTLSFIDTNLTAGTTYYYRVRSANLTGWSAYSNEAQATTVSGGPDMPLSNLALWLKADSGLPQITNGPLNIWPDQSGNGNHAFQAALTNQPLWVPGALNSFPVVHFNGTSHYLNLPNVLAGTTQAEALVVLRVTTNTPNYYPTLWRWGTSGGSYILSYPSPTGQIVDDFGSTATHSLGVPAQPLTQYHVYDVASQTGNWSAWIDGILQASTSANTYAVWNQACGLGSDVTYLVSNHYFGGDVAEVLIFNRTLTSTERAVLNQYLWGRYSLVPSITITSPTNNAVLLTGGIPINANASVTGGTLRQVEFYQGSTLVGVAPNPPYSIVWSNSNPGSYGLIGRAVGYSLCATSSVVNIRLDAPPAVSIVVPVNNALLPPPSPVVPMTVSATASDYYGITQVQLFLGTNSLGVFTNPPYTLTCSTPPSGNYSITAVALAGDGFSAASQPINIIVDTDSTQNGIGDLRSQLYGLNTNAPQPFLIWIAAPNAVSVLP